MAAAEARYVAESGPVLAEGWDYSRITPPSRLYGANGVRCGPDGRLYVAQVSGSQISAVDIESGAVEAISPLGGGIVGPDDLVFDDEGNIYATEITSNRVSVRQKNGETRVIAGHFPVANPITFHQGKLIAGQLRMDGQIIELDRDGGAPRVIVESAPMPNAFEVGPDGMLYFPVMGANEIWKVSLAGGTPERVIGDLGSPTSVKFDRQGRIVSTQIGSGEVLRIDPRTATREVIANIAPGLDNLTFAGERLFVTSASGAINEVLAGGGLRNVVPNGFNFPLDLAMTSDGTVYVADGLFAFSLRPGGAVQMAGSFFHPGYPGFTRGLAASGPGELVTCGADGKLSRWRPAEKQAEQLTDGLDEPYGVDVGPRGAVVVAEGGAGRVLSVKDGAVEVLASGLEMPMGVAVAGDGTVYVTETGAGRIVKLAGGKAETVLDGLQRPEGLCLHNGRLYAVDTDAKSLVEYDIRDDVSRTVASGLPVGAPPGVVRKPLGGIGVMLGPQGSFAGITAGPDGTLYIADDAEGAVIALKPR